LKDINFEIEQGDAVGIIGRNGAGKSTLLKLLSRVTAPTTGNIKVKGRIASLLEVGTGFHPELTGRENIFLNGAILGMRKKEIKRKFDEIVDFSGVERYIDTPVKRYSSGMYVRLAFAVAAHLESEIMIVDEVLAVGDAEFQAKCLGKMGDVSKGEGRTVLFVSHNLSSIFDLCNRSIFFQNGKLLEYDITANVILNYKKSFAMKDSKIKIPSLFIKKIKLFNENEGIYISNKDSVYISILFKQSTEIIIFRCLIYIKNSLGIRICRFEFLINEISKYNIEKKIEFFKLTSGLYTISSMILNENGSIYLEKEIEIGSFEVSGNAEYENIKIYTQDDAVIIPKLL
jgi:lipopolysaccharide transport system ATP-binding protein